MAIDSSASDFVNVARDVDVVIDFVGAPFLERNIDALALRGRLVVVSTLGGTTAPLSLRTLMTKRLQITGTMLRARSYEEKVEATRAFERDVVPLLASGTHLSQTLLAANGSPATVETAPTGARLVILVSRMYPRARLVARGLFV